MRRYGYFTDEVIQSVRQMALMSFELKLPKSCEVAVKFATHRLVNMHLESEEELLQLLPLVDNDSEVLRKMVWVVRGRHSTGMSVKEMLEVVKEPSFHSKCVEIRKRVAECDRWISDSHRKTDDIEAMFTCPNSSPAAGRFKAEEGSEHIRDAPHDGGALKTVWFKQKNEFEDSENFIHVKVESMDFFGSVWEVSMFEREINEVRGDQEESDQTKRIVLWRWDCGHSSLFPPQHGWEKVADEESGDGFHLSYFI